jgi:DNA-binding response OmpR family regulator
VIEGKHILFINATDAACVAGPGLLEQYGHRVDAVAGTAAGLERLESGTYDIVIVQASPQTESWRVCERIRRYSGRPLIVISPNADADACVRAISAGADFFLRKSCGPMELIARVSSLLQRQPQQPEPAVS